MRDYEENTQANKSNLWGEDRNSQTTTIQNSGANQRSKPDKQSTVRLGKEHIERFFHNISVVLKDCVRLLEVRDTEFS